MLSTKQVKSKIKELLSGQKFAVLATHTRDYPYTSLVGFVASEDLSYLIFAVSRESRKYSYMVENNIVSMLIDDRKNEPGDFRQASAVTIMGEAETVDSNQRQYYQSLEKRILS
ncbi:MAG: pyridoxamine 5'-phosphate oxidase family protein [Actinomycetota bacterium]|nr:pyridoxamine 5'-phosphate oxidase family protein [Actinomycetota bacterium]